MKLPKIKATKNKLLFNIEKTVIENGEMLKIDLDSESNLSGKITVSNKEAVLVEEQVRVEEGKHSVSIDSSKFKLPTGGVLIVDVIEDQNILGEQLIFLKPLKTLGVNISSDKSSYSIGLDLYLTRNL